MNKRFFGFSRPEPPSQGGGGGVWGFITGTLSDQTDLQSALDAKQPLDSDLTAIAALSPTNDDIIQRKSGAWTNRTLAQLITDLTESIQDLIGAMVSGNTETGIAVTYDDTNGKLDFAVSNFVSNSSISPTTADVTATVNTRYFADISGLTADRNFILPAGIAGDTIEIKITSGDDAYEFIIKGNTGITINAGSAATEWSRLFITGENVTLIATSASNWEVVNDGRIPAMAVITRITSTANTTHSADTDTKPDWNSATIDIGNSADLTNDRFNCRRAGYYECSGSYVPANAISDQKWINIKVWKNGTGGTKVQSSSNRQSAATSSSVAGVFLVPKPTLCAVGDYLEYYFNTEEANKGILYFDYAGGGASVLAAGVFFAVKELLPNQ